MTCKLMLFAFITSKVAGTQRIALGDKLNPTK